MVQKTLLRIISFSAITISVIAGIILSERSDLFLVHDIILKTDSSEQVVSSKQMDELKIKTQIWKNKKIWNLSTEAVFASLQTVPWIEKIEVQRQLPSTLQIWVRPKSVVAILLSSSGNGLLPIGGMGEILPEQDSKLLPDVPILRGDKLRSSADLRLQATQFILTLPADGRFSRKNLLELSFDDKHGFVVALSGIPSPVWLGDQNLDSKASRVNRVLDYLDSHSLESRVIDASYDKKVLVRLRKRP